MAGEPNDAIDSQRFMSLMINFMPHSQDIFLQHRIGTVGNDVWLVDRRILAAVGDGLGFREWWQAAVQYFLEELVDEIANVNPFDLVTFDKEEGKCFRSTFETYGPPESN